jgi:NhaP-type Na+/H+ or K+/H+ antiporter
VADRPVAIIAFTVLLSVVLHGLSADPLARRYGPRLAPAPADLDLPQVAERRLIRHHRAT